jgi:hypothetical protein
MRKTILNLSLLIGALILIAVVVSLLFPTPPPPPLKSLPNPNGYDTFVKAAAMIPPGPANFGKLDHDGLLAFVENNTNALQLARTGLSLECQVPLEFSQAFIGAHINDLAGMKHLSEAFAAEAKLADMENRPQDAAKSCLDAIHLGAEAGRGGLLIHELVGLAMESIGTRQLQRLPGRLDAAACRETVKTLESIDTRREPWKDIWEREHEWSRRAAPDFRTRIIYLLNYRFSMKAVAAKAETRYNERVAEVRRMMIQFAELAFEQEKHQKAKGFADLVPDYLKAVPLDPETHTNMVFPP